MFLAKPRNLLFLAVFLDALGQFLALFLLSKQNYLFGFPVTGSLMYGQVGWLLFTFMLYPLMGWLFGSFTVLRWRQLPYLTLLQRLLFTSVAFLLVVAIARWIINPNELVWIVYRRVQISWLVLMTGWSLLIRFGLRKGLLLTELPTLYLLAEKSETQSIMRAWHRVAAKQTLHPIDQENLWKITENHSSSICLAFTNSIVSATHIQAAINKINEQDPRWYKTTNIFKLFEQYQERIPPSLLPETELVFDDLPWVDPFSLQVQLKRAADVIVSFMLLIVSIPVILIACLLIWLEDQGPIFYTQTRSGLLGQPFIVFKLRTMKALQNNHLEASWTQPSDQRITAIGYWLRKFRVDELPQLINVLTGEMSLIGPRPERPELEQCLERNIPHYRKRHWMRPGLSGWAQVCAPYASSIEDSDLKLSYDIFYLRNFSNLLDLLILFRTIKTILKAGGR